MHSYFARMPHLKLLAAAAWYNRSMSDNRFDFESRRVHFRRYMSRLFKRLKHLPLTIADISVIHAVTAGGTVYEARRANADGGDDEWAVYRISRHAYESADNQTRYVVETLRSKLNLQDALDELIRRCPQCLTSDATRYNHPAQVYKLVRHTFT